MGKPFKNPIAYTERKSSKWFIAPTKEQGDTGRFMPAGDDYGLGFKNPIGSKKQVNDVPTLPRESKCFNPDDAIRKP